MPHRRLRWIWISGVPVLLVLAGLTALLWSTQPPEFVKVRARFTPSEAYLLDRHGELLDTERLNFGVRRFAWVPLDAISPALIDAVVSGEDQRFWRHGGVDAWAALGAIRDQLFRHQRRGASTITMQLAALLEHAGHQRSTAAAWQRKLRQVRLARGLEAQWSKQQILEAYLNLLEFRGDLQGIGAATQVLVHKAPSGLSAAESVVLAALLPEPGAEADRVAARACARAVARNLALPCATIRQSVTELLARTSEPTNRLTPQLAHALLKTAGERVQTTLDIAVQRIARDVLSRQLADLATRNVRDGAVLVVENATGNVLAYVGSAGPNSRAMHVDGVRARRQAGSTLKPFLYELAIERRYLTAASLLDDSQLNLDTASGVYIPQDYDHDFKGLVSMRTALGSSLNVPAVRALVLVGVEAFRNRLRDLGYAGITEDGEFYGYSLALGSAEVSLWEQAQAYRTLARGGRWSALRLLPNEDDNSQKELLSADASFVIGDILSDRAARALTFGLDNHLNTSFWSAAKTGTSKDMRDNWCVGYSQQFTVAVWVGNFEGDPMRDVSGVTGAAPVWHEVMAALHQNVNSLPPSPPPGVTAALTHFLPAIESPRQEWFLADTQAPHIVALSNNGELSRIASPANGMIIALDPDIPGENQRVPIAAKGASAGMLLMLNGTVLGPASKQTLWAPKAGVHHLVLDDGHGHALDRVLFTVR